MSRKNSNANNGGNQKNRGQNQNKAQKSGNQSGKKRQQTDRSDLKPTRCSVCRFNRTNEPCYQKAHLLSEQEYIDCVPAMIHYSEKKLAQMNMI